MRTTNNGQHGNLGARLLPFALLLTSGCGSPAPAESPSAATTAETPPEAAASAPPRAASTPAAPADTAKRPGATVAETRTNEVIRGIVLQDRQRFRACYETALDQQPTLTGKLTIQFTIGSSGKVVAASVNTARTTLQDPKVQSCVLAAIQTLVFPASSRGFESSVNYPFDFKP